MALTVQLQNTFSGPLDLLLYLVKRDEIDIHEIPLAHLTREYLAELKKMPLIDIETGGEFIAMATMLTELKSRYLLPPAPPTEGEEDEVLLDPRQGLVQALLEYKQFKQAAGALKNLATIQEQRFARQALPMATFKPLDGSENFNALDLFAAFQKIMQRLLATQRRREIVNEEVPTEVRIKQIETALAENTETTFTALLSDAPTRDEMVGFFIAILELIRLRKIRARQAVDFSEIYLARLTTAENTINPNSASAFKTADGGILYLVDIFRPRRKISAAKTSSASPKFSLFPRQVRYLQSPRRKWRFL